ncbi:putative membrane protein [Bacillus sp. SORGH_AS 510]|uniref:putative ABC transporter permease n=1 Tax=Bacillus sp. SORGH_AS_0510 TaxID=3041771 RepID=UPI002782D399|nr:putative ABC transporter permease [Bacillus sp. SORGH_AS_0510]MDQ1144373.1 putative membrane protein [Bacillus sp. SORGH_AS_0510]
MSPSILTSIDFSYLEWFSVEGAARILFYFTAYSFIGWLLENSYSFFTKKIFFKENFLYGPFKPMYGFAPILLVYLVSPKTHWSIVLFLCVAIPTLVEYVSGALLQKLFHKQWWDYSDTPLQLHGHICIPFSICWGILAFICIHWVHPHIVFLYESIAFYWGWIWSAVGLYFLADLVLAIRKHSLQELLTEEPTNPIQ